jgi:putative transposase
MVTQQARNLLIRLGDHAARSRFLIRDRDSKFTAAFGTAFAGADIRIIRTPVRAPRANAIAERWIGTLRRECLDHLLITGPRHLAVVLQEYIARFNTLWGRERCHGLSSALLRPGRSRDHGLQRTS